MTEGPGFLSKLKGIATDVGSSAAQAGKNIVDTVSNIVGDSEFDHIKYLDQLSRQHKGQKKKFTVQELQAAEERADKFIQSLHPGYVDDEFDAVKYELGMLDTDAGPEEMDALVEKLASGVECVSGKLSRHVMKRRDRLLEGINTVASTEDDLRQALFIVRSSRSTLATANEAVVQNMRVAGQTRRKQGYMQLVELCAKIKSIKDLQHSLKHAQEKGEYGEAILLCVQSFQEVETLKELNVYADLHATVQRRYVDTLQRLDHALTALCGHFNPVRYSKVLEAYMLQGVPGQTLSEKVMQCYVEFINDATMRVVRSMLLLKPKMTDLMSGSSSLEGSYMEMCRNLPVDLLRPCLLKLMEVIYEGLASYHVMFLWHQDGLEQQKLMAVESAAAAKEAEARKGETNPDSAGVPVLSPAEEAAANEVAQKAGINYLTSVAQTLTSSRKEIFDLGTRRIMDLLTIPGLFKGEDFLQVVEWTQKYLGVGEAFVGCPLPQLRRDVGALTSKFFDTFHRCNMEDLEMLIENEEWKNIGKSSPDAFIDMDKLIRHSPLLTLPYNDPEGVKDFVVWLEKDNPFKMNVPPAKRNAKSAWGLAISRKALAGSAASVAKRHPLPPPGEGPSLPSRTQNGSFTVESAKSSTSGSGFEAGLAQRTSSDLGASASMVDADGTMLTVSSKLMLKLMHAYGQLLQPLPHKAETILHAMFDMFDQYLLAAFIYFSGVSMEVLVWQDDVLPNRLKSVLMRILTAEGSIYKAQVEELIQTKPQQQAHEVPVGAQSGISFLDKFAAKMESIANDLERSAQRLGDRATAMPSDLYRAADGDIPSKSFASDPTNLHGLHERIVAAQSITHVAETLKGGKQALIAVLPPILGPEVEEWFSPRGTIPASSEMQLTLIRGGARALLQPMLDRVSGTAAQIASTDYNLKEPATKQHRWADAASFAYQGFKASMMRAQLPDLVKYQIWQHAIETGRKVMVEGMSRIRECTVEGRASLGLDLAYVEKQLKASVPEGFVVDLTTVEQYVKAFFLPWDDLPRWCQLHLPQYGKRRVVAFVELYCKAHKIRKPSRNELLQQIEVFSREFSCTY